MVVSSLSANFRLCLFLLIIFIIICINGNAQQPESPGPQNGQLIYEFQNGKWFNGTEFVKQTFYSENGFLRKSRPAQVDTVIDLAGSWIVPPYGEAHNHNVEDPGRLDDLISRYMENGVFYVKNPNVLPGSVAKIRDNVNNPSSIDVSFAFGGFTGPGGHPSGVVERNIRRGIWTEADGEGAFYYEIANKQGLDRKWPAFLNHNPDFVKAYLLYSEEFEARAGDDQFIGWRGLNPDLLHELTRRAHAAGLRVSVHVETAQDFRHAVDAGVDEVNHLPGFRGNEENLFPDPVRFRLDERDAKRAAEKGIVVVTTLGDFDELEGTTTAQRANDIFRWNLNLLKKHGVKVAIGSDSYSSTDVEEALQVYNLNVFSNLELLKILVEETPKTIFPNRKIARLEDGYEASFLALKENPLDYFSAVNDISLRMKQGVIFSPDKN